MSTASANVAKYLRRYAEPEAALAARVPGRYRAVLVVPAHAEPAECVSGFVRASAAAAGKVLVILVVNAAVDASETALDATRALLKDLDTHGFSLREHAAMTLVVVDRASAGRELPAKQGVGLARKIGADLALALWAEGRVELPFVFSSDADAALPADYFVTASSVPAAGCGAPVTGLCFPFEHVPCGDLEVDEATSLYELLLRYHVLGLHAAASPYAYHSMGSCLAVGCEAYAQVRGFPKRLAGEDFYLLEKLAKLGAVLELGGEPVAIRARVSERVPFGTGPRVRELGLERRAGRGVRANHPEVYLALGLVLRAMRTLSETRDRRAFTAALGAELGVAALGALSQVGLDEEIKGALEQTTDPVVMLRRLLTWFDALKTQRFIHALRDTALPNVTLEHALATAPFVPALAASGPAEMLAELRAAERRGAGPRGIACTLAKLGAAKRLSSS